MSRSRQAENPRQAAEFVAERLREAGHVALFAGGCVRDLLLAQMGRAREPADFDVATDAPPAAVRELFRRTLLVGEQFGVVIVLVGPFHVEVATFRSESGYADGRHPAEVRFSDPRQDAARRDFTINGMFMDPAGDDVIDYVGGRDDLARGLVRAIGQPVQRFEEDHLRMLRAVRFACVLEFELDAATAEAIRRSAGRIVRVSRERIWQEWAKVLDSPQRARGLRLARQTGLFAALWPGLGERADTVQTRFDRLADEADPTAALAAQFLDLGRDGADRACRDLALDNESREAVLWLIAHAADLVAGPLDVVGLKKLMANGSWLRLVHLSRATSAGEAALDANLAAAAAVPPDQVAPPPLIDGADVLALGVAEGPTVGRILSMLYDDQLAGRLVRREQALARARELADEGESK